MDESRGAVAARDAAGERHGAARDRDVPLSRGSGPWLYGALFVLVLPVALVLWSSTAYGLSGLPALQHTVAGIMLFLLGLLLWGWAVYALKADGGGLPMNAFPPRRYVTSGPYRLLRHPIYVGFGLMLAGATLWAGSRAALWLVLPVTVLAMTALVWGHEGPVLRARFGESRHRPWLALIAPGGGSPAWRERAATYLLVLLPWLLAWSVVQLLGMPADAFSLELRLDRATPVLPWTWYVYATTYAVIPLLPLVLERAALRRLSVAALLATAVVLLLWLVLPVSYVPRAFSGNGAAATLLTLDRRWCTGMAAFPSFHVLWALLAAGALSQQWPRARALWWCWALAVAVSCLTTGMHGLLDVLAAAALYPLVQRYERSWAWLRHGAERVANSWHEWHIGRVRVISHGLWAGLAGATGAASLLLLATGAGTGPALAVSFAGLLGAGLWAQLIESSSGLLRPFGYYGAVFGTVALALASPLLGFDGLLLLAALAVGAPWVQLLGRLRCLVQGCCHGHITNERVGIRYRHPRSRVSYLAGLAGEPLHPTPLYSMLSNAVLGLVLMRLWWVGAPQLLVIGVYLIGNGLSRFVEEGYRGEPQTPIFGGLRLYQWLAVGFVIAGAVATTVATPPPPEFVAPHALAPYVWIVVFGVITGVAMGVDVPGSNRRFSRLA